MAAARRRVAPAPKDFIVELSTGTWEVYVEPFRGLSKEKKHQTGTIVIPPSPETQDRLDTFIHEPLHAALPGMSEAEVTRVAGDLAKVLWKAGYRRR